MNALWILLALWIGTVAGFVLCALLSVAQKVDSPHQLPGQRLQSLLR